MLFKAQNGEKNNTGPGLLLYYRGMPACLLANQYIFLGIINGTRAIVHKVVLCPNSKNISSDSIKANEKQVLLKGLIL